MFTRIRRGARVVLLLLAVAGVLAGCGVPADVPSCSPSRLSQGPHGFVDFQQQSSGSRVNWVVRADNQEFQTNGQWMIDVFSDGRRVDHKEQNYAPHGSVHPNDVRPGKLLEVEGHVTSDLSNAAAVIRGVCRMA